MIRITEPWLTDLPAQMVCALLKDAGYQAWFVGGCIRNALLAEPVSDLDVSTDARPDTVISLATTAGLKVVPTGIDHGTVTILAENVPFEVTTFRRDVATDGRRATVAFADNMADDARRRDFTMNALYADADGNVVDPLGGLPDLKARRVVFIEDADQRIKEDYLRILRFFRFHAWYGDPTNGLDQDGLAACAANIDGLGQLSKERIASELLKLLGAPDPAPSVAAMAATGALMAILPGAAAASLAVLVHIEQQQGIAPDPICRLALLGGDPTKTLRLSNEQNKHLEQLKSSLGHLEAAYRFGEKIGVERIMIEAASLGQEIDSNTAKNVKIAANQSLPVTAADFMPERHGPALGKALRAAEARWIASGFTLTKDDLLG